VKKLRCHGSSAQLLAVEVGTHGLAASLKNNLLKELRVKESASALNSLLNLRKKHFGFSLQRITCKS
jgi:hypothetical protein